MSKFSKFYSHALDMLKMKELQPHSGAESRTFLDF